MEQDDRDCLMSKQVSFLCVLVITGPTGLASSRRSGGMMVGAGTVKLTSVEN